MFTKILDVIKILIQKNQLKNRDNYLVGRSLNMIVTGQIGERVQTKVINKEEFKKEIAPKNAIIEELKVDGVNCVKITY
ncbi:hypothetical protein [Lysinibacillus fusiformis]|uniref:hypothetical protein n=1 Tax=Lysinibacillus fusiformis TaxID=28031 RepID=UPI00187F618B|nr:hypothetical protein [Lysinibacillus fusiformis]MBD8523723.1 hypothetical protein [Lysinibacillus fusiformis]